MSENINMEENTAEYIHPIPSTNEELISETDEVSHESENEYNGNLDADIPAQVEKFLDFIKFDSKGTMLLGSSNLTGRLWNGSVWLFNNPKVAPNVLEATAGYSLLGTVCDGCFINDTTVVVGTDNGHLSFYNVTQVDEHTKLEPTANAEDHTESIRCVDITCDAKNILTSSNDCSIKIWDSVTTALAANYNPAQGGHITCVAPHPKDPQKFLSTSLDGNCLLWDLRQDKPASCVYRDYNNSPICAAWVGEESQYIVGVQSGDVHLGDISDPIITLSSLPAFTRPVYKFSTNKHRKNLVAACANESKVLVLEVESDNLSIRYTDDSHSDFVRGIAWQNNETLYSCGWDKMVNSHFI